MASPDTRQEIVPPKDFIPFDKEAVDDSIVHRFESICLAYPEKIAIRSEGESITYKQLNERANRLAQAVIERSGRTPHPVPFLLEHGISAIVALMGILKTGKSYVALDPTFPEERLMAIIRSTGSDLLVTNHNNLPVVDNLISDCANIEVLNLDLINNTNFVGNLDLPISPDAIAYIVFTSGSTGIPKGVIRTHRNTLFEIYRQTNSQKISPSDRYALFLSISYEASRAAYQGTLLNGATLFLFNSRKYGLHLLPDWLETEQVTILLTTPSAFHHLFDSVPKNHKFQGVRFVSLAGEPSTNREAQVFLRHFSKQCSLLNTLGSSEGGVLTRYVFERNVPLQSHFIPVGYPVPGKEVFIVTEQGEIIEDDQVGEIVVKSQYLSPGYWNQPSLTQEKFFPDPENDTLRIYHTGDLGCWRSDGCMIFIGRKDSQLKIRGYRVEIEEIEAALYQHPSVQEACVTAWAEKDSSEEKSLVAYIVPDHSQLSDPRSIRAYLNTKLPDYMVPGKFIFIDKLPLTPAGKVDRTALPPPRETSFVRERSYVEPRDDIETQVVRIWEKVLEITPIGIQDDFFELGGSSLQAAQIFTEIEKTFGKRIPLATLYQATCISQQTDFIRRDDWIPDWSSLVTLQSGNAKPPLFLAAPIGGNVIAYRNLILHLGSDQPCYGLQAVGLDGIQAPMRSVSQIAKHFIKQIKTVHPDGPYYLSGTSFGGLVAYEMAQQLHDQGKSIALVVMFDTYGPNYPKPSSSTPLLLRKISKYLKRFDTHIHNLIYTDWKGRWIYLKVRILRLYNRFFQRDWRKPEQVLDPVPQKEQKVRMAQTKAARRTRRNMHDKRRFDGRLVLFRAENQPSGIYPDPKLGWGEVVGDEIEIYEIPGGHGFIKNETSAGVVAEKLKQILAEVQDAQSSI